MALSNSTLDMVLVFNFENQTIQLQDNYDYADETIPLTEITAVAKITGPTGVEVMDELTTPDYNDPTIDHDTAVISDTYSLGGNLDDETDEILQGDYVAVVRVRRMIVDAEVIIVGESMGVNGATLPGDFLWLEAGDVIILSGNVNGGSNGTFTISSVEDAGANTIIYVEETLGALESPAAVTSVATVIKYYNKTFTLCLDVTIPTIDISASHNCKTLKFKAQDDTEYSSLHTVGTKNWTLAYPRKANGDPAAADYVTTGNSWSVSPLWTGTYSLSMEVIVTVTLENGVEVSYTLGATISHTVKCNKGLTSAYECLKKFHAKIQEACSCGKITPQLQCAAIEISYLFGLIDVALASGDQDGVSTLCERVITVSKANGCSCGCSEVDGVPELVTSTVNAFNVDADSINIDEIAGHTTPENVQEALEDIYALIDALDLADFPTLAAISLGGSNQSDVETILNYLKYPSGRAVVIDGTAYNVGISTAAWAVNYTYDLFANNCGYEIEFSINSSDAANALAIEEVSTGTTFAPIIVGISTGRVRIFLYRNGANMSYRFQVDGTTNAGQGNVAWTFSGSHTLRVKWTAGAGTRSILHMTVKSCHNMI